MKYKKLLVLILFLALSRTIYCEENYYCENQKIGHILIVHENGASYGSFKLDDCERIENKERIFYQRKDGKKNSRNRKRGCIGKGAYIENQVSGKYKNIMNWNGNENIKIFYGFRENVSSGKIIILDKHSENIAIINSNEFTIKKLECKRFFKKIG